MLATVGRPSLLHIVRARWRSYVGKKPVLRDDLIDFLFNGILIGIIVASTAGWWFQSRATAGKWFVGALILAGIFVVGWRLVDFFIVGLRSNLRLERELRSSVERFEKAIAATHWVCQNFSPGYRNVNGNLGRAADQLAQIPDMYDDIQSWYRATLRLSRQSYLWLALQLETVLRQTGAPLPRIESHFFLELDYPEQFMQLLRAIMQTERGVKLANAGSVPEAVTYWLQSPPPLPLVEAAYSKLGKRVRIIGKASSIEYTSTRGA